MRPFLDGTLAKMIAKTLCHLTRVEGAGMVSADGGDVRLLVEALGVKVVNLTPEDRLGTVTGPLTSKAITRFLWENRGWRALGRPNLVVWSVVQKDNTYIGVGALVGPKVASRYRGRKILE